MMFSTTPPNYSFKRNNTKYRFPIHGQDSIGIIELIKDPNCIDKETAMSVLVESFIGEYEKYLSPHEIDESLNSWRDGDKSVRKYYEDYFKAELEDFSRGIINYWVQASIDGKLVGWATYQREKLDQNAVYMNLLVVHPKCQKRGIGAQLVKALINLHEISNLSEVHLLLRKKNKGGRVFYAKLGFASDPEYKREDNFVNMDLLEPLTWKNPDLQKKQEIKESDTYCGFKPGFLIGKRF